MSLLNQITIRTPESVELKFTLAGIGNRGIALIVDYIIWGLLLIVMLFVWIFVAIQFEAFFSELDNAQLWLLGFGILIVFAVYNFYFVLFETLWQGQTPGKRYAKIRVVRDNGQPVGLAQSLLRSLLRFVDDILFLGMILIIFGKKEKRLGDWVAGTIVIQEDRPASKQGIATAPQAQELATQLLSQANVGALLPDDFAVIREYLQRRTSMEERAKATLGRKLTEQASQLMEMQVIPFEMSPELFLEAVYLAYQQQ